MSSSGRWLGNLFGQLDLPLGQIPSSGFKLLNTVEKLEEENWDWYSVDTYYPVQIGETYRSRYHVLGKLGYGAHPTAWLGRDLQYVPAHWPFPYRLQTLELEAQCTTIRYIEGLRT